MKEDARNMNDLPDRFELFTLEEGEEKVTMEYDSRIPNTAIFTFAREDHTLGNLLASALLSTEHVHFAAYKVPHPLFSTFILRVSTSNDTGPREALEAACKRVIHDLQDMAKQFTREWEIWKLTNEAAAGREDEEKEEREKRMAEARKVRDRIREEMLREGEAMTWSGRGGGASSDAPWDDGPGGGGVSPQWDGSNGDMDEITSGKVPWDGQATSNYTRAPWDEPTEPTRALWDGPSPATPAAGDRAPWDEPIESRSAPWDDNVFNSGESPRDPSNSGGQSSMPTWNQPAESAGGRAPWDEADTSRNSRQRSPTREIPSSGRAQPYHQSSPQSTRAPWNESISDNAFSTSGRRTLTHKQRFASPTAAAPWNRSAGGARGSRAPWDKSTRPSVQWDADDTATVSPPREPNSAGEQAYLSRPPAVVTSARASDALTGGSGSGNNQRQQAVDVAPWNVPAGRDDGGRALWGQGERSGSGNEPLGGGGGGTSPQWDADFGGNTPVPKADGRAPWDDY